jgi:hypothetical protein
LYKVVEKPGLPWKSIWAAASLTTVFRVSAEMHARTRGGGALKLEPSDICQLLIADANPNLSGGATNALLWELDALLRGGQMEAATEIADKALLIDTKVLTVDQLESLRQIYSELLRHRLPSRAKKNTA